MCQPTFFFGIYKIEKLKVHSKKSKVTLSQRARDLDDHRIAFLPLLAKAGYPKDDLKGRL